MFHANRATILYQDLHYGFLDYGALGANHAPMLHDGREHDTFTAPPPQTSTPLVAHGVGGSTGSGGGPLTR